MKKLLLMLVCASFSGAAFSDSKAADVLISRCEKLKRQTDRDSCIKEAIRISEAKSSPEKKVDAPLADSQEASFPRTSEDVWRGAVKIKTDNFSKEITYSTNSTTDGWTYGSPEYTWTTNAYVEKATGKTSFMISFADIYGGNRWKFWRYADSDKAEKLDVVSGNKRVSSCSVRGGCIYSESLAILLTKEFLVSAANEGREIKLQSSNGDSFIFKLSSDEASNLLSAVDACKNTGCKPAEIKVSEKRDCTPSQSNSPNYSLWSEARGAGC